MSKFKSEDFRILTKNITSEDGIHFQVDFGTQDLALLIEEAVFRALDRIEKLREPAKQAVILPEKKKR